MLLSRRDENSTYRVTTYRKEVKSREGKKIPRDISKSSLGNALKTEREKWVKSKSPRDRRMTDPWLTQEVLRERSFYLRKIGFICQQLAPASSSGHLQNSHTVQVWGEKSQDQCQWERRFNIWNPIRKTIFVSLRVSWGRIGSSL